MYVYIYIYYVYSYIALYIYIYIYVCIYYQHLFVKGTRQIKKHMMIIVQSIDYNCIFVQSNKSIIINVQSNNCINIARYYQQQSQGDSANQNIVFGQMFTLAREPSSSSTIRSKVITHSTSSEKDVHPGNIQE